MTIADEIVQAPSGARFFRADLHIHSFGGSHDVTDSSMTPDGIIKTAVAENLQLIAITDHNEITNVAALLNAAAGQPVTAIPGVELSTPEGHVLVYFGALQDLSDFFGKLDIADRGMPNSRCQTSLLECLKKVNPAKGFAILAHVDGDGGFEQKVPGAPPHKMDVISHPALLALELRDASSPVSYADTDPLAERVQLGKRRLTALGLGDKQFLARVLFSDSHALTALGKNAKGNRKVTRVKMDSPSFEGLRIALQDGDARIRLEDEIPQSIPYVVGIKLQGGFLDGQTIHFSRNLNCIIGGRGAGKSTAFEAVRCLSTVRSESRLIDSEVWPEALHLLWVDQVGQQHPVIRRIEEENVNSDDPDWGPSTFPMESYGQNETAQTSVKAQSDPGALLAYLDQFVDIEGLSAEDEKVREELLSNQTDIEKAQQQTARIPDYKKFLANVQQQLKALEAANAKDVVALERKVAEERGIRLNIEKQVAGLSSQVKDRSILDMLTELQKAAEPKDLRVGAAEYKTIVELASAFQGHAKATESELTKRAVEFSGAVKKELENWKTHEQKILSEIEEKRKALLQQGVKLDLAYIKKLAADESTYKQALKTLEAWDSNLKSHWIIRSELLTKRQIYLSQISTRRTAYATLANRALRGALSDLTVTIRFADHSLSPEAEEIIQQAMNWRTVQVPRASLIVEQLTVPRLLHAIRRNDPQGLINITAADSSHPFNKTDALDILRTLGAPSTLFRLERCKLEDRPNITVTKAVARSGGKVQHVSRDFSKLSLGQQQSVLLALMLSSNSNAPLIIDQPEDNLDSEFIFHSLVPVLRAAKERRQVIIVTHNPNIAVLGDAEQIIALKSTSDKSTIVAQGSIDEPKTKKVVCQILEGAEEAFRRRAKVYGVI